MIRCIYREVKGWIYRAVVRRGINRGGSEVVKRCAYGMRRGAWSGGCQISYPALSLRYLSLFHALPRVGSLGWGWEVVFYFKPPPPPRVGRMGVGSNGVLVRGESGIL